MLRILFVESSDADARVGADTLREAGIVLESAAVASLDGLRDALAGSSWSAVISDYDFAGFNAFDVIAEIRERHLDVPLIVVSATIGEERAADLVRAGARDYVPKDRLARLPHVLVRELHDAMERKERAELASALQDSQRRFRLTFEHAPIGIVHADREGRILETNVRFAQIVGYAREELIGRRVIELSHPDDLNRTSGIIQQFIEGEGEVEYERRYVSKGGEVVWVRVRLTPVCDAAGRLDNIIGLAEDITPQKRAEAKLHSSERQLAEAQRIAHVGSWVADLQTGEVTWSDEMFRLHELPITRPRPPEATVLSRVHPDDRERIHQLYVSALRDGEPYDAEYRIRLADGSVRMLRSHSRFERDAEGRIVEMIGATHDVTETRRREKELETLAIQHAAAANLGQFALTGASTEQLFRQATTFAKYLVEADECELLEVTPHGYRSSASTTGEQISLTEDLQSPLVDHVIANAAPCMVDDTWTETRFGTERLRSHGFRSASVIPLAVGFARPWGAFAVYSRVPNQFTEATQDFLRSLAPVLGQAIESEHARRALIASEENYRSVIEGASEIIFTISPSGVIVALNPAFGQITGLDPREWIGGRIEDLVVPADRDMVVQQTARVVATRQSTGGEVRIGARDREILLCVTSFPRIEDGRVTAIYGFARDITSERAAEAERERLTRNLQLILDSTAEGLCTIDTEGRCTMVNRAFTTLLGYEAEEVIGARPHDLVHDRRADGSPLSLEECAIVNVLRDGAVMALHDDLFWRKDGTPLPVVLSAAPIVDKDETVGVVVAITEVAERRKLEAKLEQATRLSSLGRLAATVAHEFNNVLMGISPFVEVLRRNPSPDRVATALDQIGRSIKRGKRITEEILRFTQPAEPTLGPIEVGSWLESLAAEAQSLLPPSIDLTLDVPPEPITIDGDAGQLHQVLLNLVLNARDAMPEGGSITIAARVPSHGARFPFGAVEEPDRFVHLSVGDSGDGIPAAALQHIFEPLFTTKKSGTGLGLAVAHQIVLRHGGEIFVETEQGAGTAFHLFIPLSTRHTVQAAAHGGDDTGRPGVRRILLVEDDSAVSSGLIAMLEIEGLHVALAESGAETMTKLEESLPDVVLLDVGLPDMDGTDVYEMIAARHPNLPIVFSTGHGDPASLEKHLVRGHVSMLRKPYETAALLATIEEVFSSRRR